MRIKIVERNGQRGFELSISRQLDDWLRRNGFELWLVVGMVWLWLVW